jgi:hypothetical protein
MLAFLTELGASRLDEYMLLIGPPNISVESSVESKIVGWDVSKYCTGLKENIVWLTGEMVETARRLPTGENVQIRRSAIVVKFTGLKMVRVFKVAPTVVLPINCSSRPTVAPC